MKYEPFNKKKFKSRKFRLDPTDNFKLDRIRGEGQEESGQRGKLNILLAFSAAVLILIAAFLIPQIAKSVITRRHADALVNLKKTYDLLVQEMAVMPDDGTILVIEQSDRYYLFWCKEGASVISEDRASSIPGFVELDNPRTYQMPINVEKGKELEYPFTSEPIKIDNGGVKLTEGLLVLEGYVLKEYIGEGENGRVRTLNNVKLYELVKIG